MQNVFSTVAAFEEVQPVHLRANGTISIVHNEFVSGDFFSVLGIRPAVGRFIGPADDAPAVEPTAILRYGYWQTRFGADPSFIGRTVLIEEKPVTIAGVAPAGFTGLDPGISCDMWLPLSSQPYLVPGWFAPVSNSLWLELVARRKAGVSIARAESEISGIFARRATAPPDAILKPEDTPSVRLLNLTHGLVSLRRYIRKPLFLLLTGVGIILLIACANIAGLLLARAAARQKEMAVRLALGATRGRIVRQLLTESLLIALVGGALGIGMAYRGAVSLATFLSSNGRGETQIDVHPDPHVLLFTFFVAGLTGILCGLAPAYRGTRVDLTPALKMSGGNILNKTRGARRFMLGGGLVVAQVALSMVVLMVAGLFVRTLINLTTENLGFDAQNILLFDVDADPRVAGYQQTQIQSVRAELQRQLSSLPGVISATYSSWWPLGGSRWTVQFRLPDVPEKSPVSSIQLAVGPSFFETLHIPFLAGRDFAGTDFDAGSNTQPVVINRSLAHRLFGEENPLGRHFSDTFRVNLVREVVGVVADAKTGASPRDELQPAAYFPDTTGGSFFELRTAGNPRALIPGVRRVVSASNALATGFATQTEEIGKTLFQERLFAWLSTLFGLLALALVCVGLYGLLAYEVTQRISEIGIRMALGARPHDVLRLFIGRGIVLVLIGGTIGVAITLGVTRFLKSRLYAIAPSDPMTFIGVGILLIAVALLACYIPVRRATRVDPMVALRHE